MKAAILGLLGILVAIPAHAMQSAAFVVLRDDTPIGVHQVEVWADGPETHVSVTISLDVGLGPIPLYRYRHASRETWLEGRLVRLDSRTDDDGEVMSVRAQATATGLRVTGSHGTFEAPADAVPTSYWNPGLVEARPLLDSQSGRLLEVRRVVVAPGRWRLSGDLQLEIAYSPDGVWSGMSFHHLGSDFHYQPRRNAGARP